MTHNDPVHPDQRYIDALLQNDRVLIGEIYTRFAVRIAAFVRSNRGTDKDAQDLFQEALLAIYRQARAGGLRLVCPFEAYLYVLCRRKWIDELNKRQREGVTMPSSEGYHTDAGAQELAEETAQGEARERLFRRMFQVLGERCQELLRLAWSGQGMEAAAEKMGVSYGYARKKKTECTARLMELIRSAPEYRSLM